MGLSDYQITIISPTSGQVIKVLDSRGFTALHYSLALNDIGALVMTFTGEDDLTELFPLDALIDVQRTSPITGALELEETYFARLTHRLREGDQEQFIVGGLSLNHLMSRRLIDPADDPLQAGGYSTKAGAADAVMREYALEQMVQSSADRQMVDFSIATVAGTGTLVGDRLRYKNLLQALQDFAARGNVDFIVRRGFGRSMQLTIATIGSNKTYSHNYPFSGFVILDPARGNLSSPSLLVDRKKEGNFIYALGQGPGDQRITLQLAGEGILDSPWNRMEFTEDVRQAERGNALQLLTEARTKLKEAGLKTEFTFEVSGQEPGNAYRVDWEVGDYITAQWEDVQVDLRVMGVEIDLDASGENMTVQTEII